MSRTSGDPGQGTGGSGGNDSDETRPPSRQRRSQMGQESVDGESCRKVTE